jgi:glucoamylase
VSEGLEGWIARERAVAAEQLLAAVSATEIVKERPGFHQVMRPAPGSILASPVPAAYDPDPDYFFHWLRDGAVVADAMGLLAREGDAEATRKYEEYLRFSLACCDLSGRKLLEGGSPAARSDAFWRQYVRPDEELAAIEGDAVLAEPRYNPDGTLDILKWTRPQHDGPAMRALTNLRWTSPLSREAEATRAALIARDLDFTERRYALPSIDIWEEDPGFHFYTRLVQHEALAKGADWARAQGDEARAARYEEAARALWAALPQFVAGEGGYYVSRLPGEGSAPSKALDGAVLLAVLHAGRAEGLYSPLDPLTMGTADRLEALFAQEYPINHDRPVGCGVAIGRYTGDSYYSGGPYWFTTFALAELRYARAATRRDRAEFAAGEAVMAAVRRFTPPNGHLPEQVDKVTGQPCSARRLTWSYAAFLTAERTRAQALARL